MLRDEQPRRHCAQGGRVPGILVYPLVAGHEIVGVGDASTSDDPRWPRPALASSRVAYGPPTVAYLPYRRRSFSEAHRRREPINVAALVTARDQRRNTERGEAAGLGATASQPPAHGTRRVYEVDHG